MQYKTWGNRCNHITAMILADALGMSDPQACRQVVVPFFQVDMLIAWIYPLQFLNSFIITQHTDVP